MPQELPLFGIRVFEFGGSVAGPFAAWILAELGAEVTKIERPEGDDARGWGPPFWKGASTMFHAINRNKDAIALDLKDPEVVSKLRRQILEEADVVVQNLRPGALERLGLGAESLMAENPRLIYCNMWAFGAVGPMKDRPGYDALMQAFGGIMSVTGEEGRPPVRAGISVLDKGTGMWSAIGVLAALYRRTFTGKGGLIDTSLFETALTWMSTHAADYQATGNKPVRLGTGIRGIVPYQAYKCADDYLIIAASNDRLFARLAEALGHPEWAEDEKYAKGPERSVRREELNALIDAIVSKEPRATWEEKLDAAGVPNAPIQSINEILAHPQLEALGMLQDTGDPDLKLLGLPLTLDGQRPPLRNICAPIDSKEEAR